MDAVLAAEQALGRNPVEMPHNNTGYDIHSTTSDGQSVFIEVKGRIAGAEDVTVTLNEVLLGKNVPAAHRLALVEVSRDGPEHDHLRYVSEHFRSINLGDLAATDVRLKWAKTWAKGIRAAGKCRRRPACPLREEPGSGPFCPAFTLAARIAPGPDCRCHPWRCLTGRRVRRGAIAGSIVFGWLDPWVYADQSDDAACAGHRDGQGDARPWGGRVSALSRR